MSESEFTCAMCGETYEKEYSDDQAEAELAALFPGFTPDDCDLVCDDCFEKLGFIP